MPYELLRLGRELLAHIDTTPDEQGIEPHDVSSLFFSRAVCLHEQVDPHDRAMYGSWSQGSLRAFRDLHEDPRRPGQLRVDVDQRLLVLPRRHGNFRPSLRAFRLALAQLEEGLQEMDAEDEQRLVESRSGRDPGTGAIPKQPVDDCESSAVGDKSVSRPAECSLPPVDAGSGPLQEDKEHLRERAFWTGPARVKEWATRLRISQRTFHRWRNAGKIRSAPTDRGLKLCIEDLLQVGFSADEVSERR